MEGSHKSLLEEGAEKPRVVTVRPFVRSRCYILLSPNLIAYVFEVRHLQVLNLISPAFDLSALGLKLAWQGVEINMETIRDSWLLADCFSIIDMVGAYKCDLLVQY